MKDGATVFSFCLKKLKQNFKNLLTNLLQRDKMKAQNGQEPATGGKYEIVSTII